MSALLAAGLLMVAVVGCSTKKDEDVSAAESTEAQDDSGADATSTTKDASGSDDSSDDGGADDGDGSLADLVGTCGAVSAMTVTLGLGSAFLTDEQKAQVEEQLDELQGKVPDEIQDDVETISSGADVDSLTELGEFLDSDEYKQAMDNITTWVQANCDMDGPFGG
jgi:hypothetical protein